MIISQFFTFSSVETFKLDWNWSPALLSFSPASCSFCERRCCACFTLAHPVLACFSAVNLRCCVSAAVTLSPPQRALSSRGGPSAGSMLSPLFSSHNLEPSITGGALFWALFLLLGSTPSSACSPRCLQGPRAKHTLRSMTHTFKELSPQSISALLTWTWE